MAVYPQMPFLCVAPAHARTMAAKCAYACCAAMVQAIHRADSSDFRLLGEQSSPKWEIPCLGRWWTAMQNLTLLASYLAEKSVTVQTNKQKHTQTVLSTPCLLARVDNKFFTGW